MSNKLTIITKYKEITLTDVSEEQTDGIKQAIADSIAKQSVYCISVNGNKEFVFTPEVVKEILIIIERAPIL